MTSDGICLTPEQREALAAIYCADEPTVDEATGEVVPPARKYKSRAEGLLKRDALMAWILAWPEVADKELLEASEIDADRAYMSQLRASIGIPSAKKIRDDARRLQILAWQEGGVDREEIGRRLGIDRDTVSGIVWRHRHGKNVR